MNSHSPVDSRQYRFGFQLHAVSDLPDDFPIPLPASEWIAAVFIPGDTETLWRPLEYPPRVLALSQDTLTIYSHPSAGEQAFSIPVEELLEIDSEEALLRGVVELFARSAQYRFQFKTLHQKHVDCVLRAVRMLWLPKEGCGEPSASFARPSDHALWRCWNALWAELDPGEIVLRLCSQSPVRRRRKGWYWRVPQPTPAIMLALTNRRLLALSTGSGEVNDPYKIVIRSTPVCNLEGAGIEEAPDAPLLTLRFVGDRSWRLFFAKGQGASIASFLAQLRESSLRRENMSIDSGLDRQTTRDSPSDSQDTKRAP